MTVLLRTGHGHGHVTSNNLIRTVTYLCTGYKQYKQVIAYHRLPAVRIKLLLVRALNEFAHGTHSAVVRDGDGDGDRDRDRAKQHGHRHGHRQQSNLVPCAVHGNTSNNHIGTQ